MAVEPYGQNLSIQPHHITASFLCVSYCSTSVLCNCDNPPPPTRSSPKRKQAAKQMTLTAWVVAQRFPFCALPQVHCNDRKGTRQWCKSSGTSRNLLGTVSTMHFASTCKSGSKKSKEKIAMRSISRSAVRHRSKKEHTRYMGG